MDQTTEFENFKNYLINAVESRNQANRMQGNTAYFSVLNEAGIMGDLNSAVLLYTNPSQPTEGYYPAYKIDFLFEQYSELDREAQRGFFTELLDAMSSGVAYNGLKKLLKKKQKNLRDKDYVLGNVYPGVIQVDGNEEYLNQMPNRSAGETDLRIYYYVEIDYEIEEGNVQQSFVVITNNILEDLNRSRGRKISEEVLYRSAKKNISERTLVEGGMERLIRQICESQDLSYDEVTSRVHAPNIDTYYYISAPGLKCGAAAAFVMCGIDVVEDKWDNAPAYFIPYSTDEVCIRIVNGAPHILNLSEDQERRNMELLPEKRLSDSIYYYAPKNNRLTIEHKGNGVYHASLPDIEAPTEQSIGMLNRGGR